MMWRAFSAICAAAVLAAGLAAQTPGYQEAAADFSAQNFFGALTKSRQLLEAEPDNPAYLHLNGLALGALGQFSEAIVQLERAAALQPKNADYQSDLGMTLVRAGREEAAMAALKRAVQLAPDNLVARLFLGRILHNRNYSREAMEQFQEIARRDDRFPSLHYHIAKIHLNSGDAELALRELQKEVGLFPDNPLPREELAELLLKLERTREALVHLRRLEETKPPRARLYWLLGKALRAQGESEQALKSALECTRIDPSFAPGFYLLFQLYQERGQAPEARQARDRFLELSRSQGAGNP